MKSLCLQITSLGLLHSCKAVTHFYCMTTNVSRLSLRGQRQQYVTEDNAVKSTCPTDNHSVWLCAVCMSGSIQLRQIHFKRSMLHLTLFCFASLIDCFNNIYPCSWSNGITNLHNSSLFAYALVSQPT